MGVLQAEGGVSKGTEAGDSWWGGRPPAQHEGSSKSEPGRKEMELG